MRKRPTHERAQGILDALSERIEAQTFRPFADLPHVTAIVGAFHRAAGMIEADLDWHCKLGPAKVVCELRALRWLVRNHEQTRAIAEESERARRGKP